MSKFVTLALAFGFLGGLVATIDAANFHLDFWEGVAGTICVLSAIALFSMTQK